MEDVAFSIPHLRKIIFKIYTQKTPENQKKHGAIEKQIDKKRKNLVPGTYRFQFFQFFDVPD